MVTEVDIKCLAMLSLFSFFFSFFCASFKIYLNTLLKKLVLMHLFAVVEGLSS